MWTRPFKDSLPFQLWILIMAEPKQMKLHGLAIMSTPQHIKCQWCEYGRDPVRQGVCAACHAKLKNLLRGSQWHKLRLARLRDPATAFCNGWKLIKTDSTVHHDCRQQIPLPATIIDHIVPWKFKPSLFWEEENLQSLCVDCHAAKSNQDGSYNNSPRRNQQ